MLEMSLAILGLAIFVLLVSELWQRLVVYQQIKTQIQDDAIQQNFKNGINKETNFFEFLKQDSRARYRLEISLYQLVDDQIASKIWEFGDLKDFKNQSHPTSEILERYLVRASSASGARHDLFKVQQNWRYLSSEIMNSSESHRYLIYRLIYEPKSIIEKLFYLKLPAIYFEYLAHLY